MTQCTVMAFMFQYSFLLFLMIKELQEIKVGCFVSVIPLLMPLFSANKYKRAPPGYALQIPSL